MAEITEVVATLLLSVSNLTGTGHLTLYSVCGPQMAPALVQHGAPARFTGHDCESSKVFSHSQMMGCFFSTADFRRFLLFRLQNAMIRVAWQKLQGCPNHQPVSLPDLPERPVLVDRLLGMTAILKYCNSCLQPAPRTYTVTLHPSDYVQDPGE